MKKALIIISALVLVLAFTGCNRFTLTPPSSSSSSSPSSSSAPASSQETESSADTSLADYAAGIQKLLKESLSEEDMNIAVIERDNFLVYSYKYKAEIDKEASAAYLEEYLSTQTSTDFDSLASQLKIAYNASGIIVEYIAVDGDIIYTVTYNS